MLYLRTRKLISRTINDQLFFEGCNVYFRLPELGYHIDHLGHLNAIFVSDSNTEIKTLDIINLIRY